MKHFFLLITIVGCLHNASAQSSVVNIYNINDSKQNKIETYTNTEKISGQPYLTNEWSSGTVVLENGDTYNSYLLKYNTNNQTLLMQQGKECIEIEQHIKEFSLDINKHSRVQFINANIYSQNLKGYFEVVDDNKDCRLLRLNKKTGESNSEKFTNLTESKTFQNTIEYFIFNKSLKKFTTYKKADSFLKSLYELQLL